MGASGGTASFRIAFSSRVAISAKANTSSRGTVPREDVFALAEMATIREFPIDIRRIWRELYRLGESAHRLVAVSSPVVRHSQVRPEMRVLRAEARCVLSPRR